LEWRRTNFLIPFWIKKFAGIPGEVWEYSRGLKAAEEDFQRYA